MVCVRRMVCMQWQAAGWACAEGTAPHHGVRARGVLACAPDGRDFGGEQLGELALEVLSQQA